jgi:HD-GYP domain-containing protein (c-di-GMP phosphodiesterase class II)
MLHDNGITTAVYNSVEAGKLSSLEKTAAHCIKGESNLKDFPFLKPREGMILYHHESYDGSGYFGISGDNIPILAYIIHMADVIEVMYSKGLDKKAITEYIANYKERQFSPVLCEAFAEMSSHISFWLSLDNRFLMRELADAPNYPMNLSLQEIVPIARIFSKLIDEKSPFTGRHSQGIAEKSAIMADFYGFDEERKTKLVIAAYLHDAGKLAVPNAVLDKNGSLTIDEIDLVRPHTFYTRRMLEQITSFEDVTEWASNHHEKLDGTGYPYGMSADQLDFESRLMACIDIFQALTEERPYREGLDHAKVAAIMNDMVKRNAIDAARCADVLEACRE